MEHLTKQFCFWAQLSRKLNILLPDLINIVCISGIALILVSIWFRSGLTLGFTDLGLVMQYPARWFGITTNVWFDLQSTGQFFPQTMLSLLAGVMAALNMFGLSTLAIQEMLFFFMLTSEGLGMYYLTSTLIRGKERPIVSMLSGLFYMLNPYAMVAVWLKYDSAIWTYPVVPLLLAFYINGLRKKSFSYALFTSIVIALFAPAFANFAFDIVILIVLSMYFIFHIMLNIHNRNEIAGSFRFTALLIVLTFLINLWWLLPWLFSFPATYQAQATTVPSYANFQIISKYSGLFYIFRLTRGDFFYWMPIYSSGISAIGFIAPLAAFSALIFKVRNRFVIFFGLLAVFSLFFAKGSQPPLGEFSDWLIRNVPLFIVFRNPFNTWGLIISLSYSFLFGVGLVSFTRFIIKKNTTEIGSFRQFRFNARWRKVSAVVICLLVVFSSIGAYVSPMWTGALYSHSPTDTVKMSMYVKVPKYYGQLDEYLFSDHEIYRILVLPLSEGDSAYYNWQYGYFGKEPSYLLYREPSIAMRTYNSLIDNLTVDRINGLIINPDSPLKSNLWKLFALLNVKYIIINYDVNSTLMSLNSPKYFELGLAYGPATVSTQIAKTDSLAGWEPAGVGEALVSIDRSSSVNGSASLRVNVTLKAGNYQNGIRYSPSHPINLSFGEYLSFLLRVENITGLEQVRLWIYDNSGNWRMWQFYNIVGNEWQKFVVNLNEPDFESGKSFLLSNITQLYVAFISKQHTSLVTDLWIRDLNLIHVVGMYPEPYLRKVAIFGNLTLYELDEKYFVNRIYAATHPVFVPSLDAMIAEMSNTTFTPWNTVVFVRDQLNLDMANYIQNVPFDSLALPQNLTFEEISPDLYKVHVENASSPFFLVFSETYDPWWRASINGATIVQHFLINGYANAWYVAKTGSYDITIEFLGQKLFYYSLSVSFATLVICLFFVAMKKKGLRFMRNV